MPGCVSGSDGTPSTARRTVAATTRGSNPGHGRVRHGREGAPSRVREKADYRKIEVSSSKSTGAGIRSGLPISTRVMLR